MTCFAAPPSSIVAACRLPARPMRHRSVRGLALVAVLWIIVALSLLVTSLSATLRTETQDAVHLRDSLQAAALGDAVIIRWAAGRTLDRNAQVAFTQQTVTFNGRTLQLRVTPVNGLVDLNGADEGLLTELLVQAAGLSPGRASDLARRIIDWRTPGETPYPNEDMAAAYAARGDGMQARRGPFLHVEDLRQVPGLTPAIYASIAPLVHVVPPGGSRVSPQAAPTAVLAVLARGDRKAAEQIARARRQGEPNIDLTALVQDQLATGSARAYRVEAYLPVSPERGYLRRWWVRIGAGSDSGVPWQILRRDPVQGTSWQLWQETG